jgi:CBS domain containing-hemolysin-like protein
MIHLVSIACCIIGSAFFSGVETAIISASRIRIRHLAKEGHRNALRLHKYLEEPEPVLAVALVGTNIFNVLSSILAASLVISLLQQRENLGMVVATAVMTPVLLIFGETLPKTLFYEHANWIALRVVPILRFCLVVFYPLVWVCSLPTKMIFLLAPIDREKKNPFVTREELKLLIMDGQGDLNVDEQKMIDHLFRFSETAARSIMVPLSKVVATDVRGTVADALERIRESGHSRILLYKGRIERFVGHVAVQDIVGLSEDTRLSRLRRPIVFVPESKRISELLLHLNQVGHHMAIVVNRYRRVCGLVTLEDIVEEIVGEIHDEYDSRSHGIGR